MAQRAELLTAKKEAEKLALSAKNPASKCSNALALRYISWSDPARIRAKLPGNNSILHTALLQLSDLNLTFSRGASCAS